MPETGCSRRTSKMVQLHAVIIILFEDPLDGFPPSSLPWKLASNSLRQGGGLKCSDMPSMFLSVELPDGAKVNLQCCVDAHCQIPRIPQGSGRCLPPPFSFDDFHQIFYY